MNCGVSCMSFLYDTLLIAIVPDGTNKSFTSTKVFLWDEKYQKNIGDYEFN